MSWNIDLSNKTVLITGGVRGIGLSLVNTFLSTGANVIVTSKSSKSLDAFNKTLSNKRVISRKLDVTNDISISQLVKSVESIDILINTAVLVKGGLEYRIENFSDVVNTNLMGLMRITHGCLPKIAIQKGCIINISSIFSSLGYGTSPSYAATKAGISSLTKSMASCWAEHNVRVNSISPGWIDGLTSDNLIKDNIFSKKEIINRIPMGRYGKYDEISGAAVFLASEYASYITGTDIVIDGGYTCM